MRDLRHLDTVAGGDLADWLVYLDLEGKAARTITSYGLYIKPLLLAHPDKPFRDFSHQDVNEQLRLVSQRSRHIVRCIYNRWFEWGVLDHRLDLSPMGRVPRVKHPKRRPKDIFSELEAQTLQELPVPDGPLFTIMFGTGIRRGECRRLRLQDIDSSRGLLKVFAGKGDKDRIVPVPMRVLVALEDLRILEGLNPADHLWYSRPRGGPRRRRDPIGDTTFDRWYKVCLETAGVRYLNPHQTRHTYGHRLRDQGFDLEERQLLMGHEDIQTTQRYYGHLTIEDVARKMALKDLDAAAPEATDAR